jgi:hypothetical protein
MYPAKLIGCNVKINQIQKLQQYFSIVKGDLITFNYCNMAELDMAKK